MGIGNWNLVIPVLVVVLVSSISYILPLLNQYCIHDPWMTQHCDDKCWSGGQNKAVGGSTLVLLLAVVVVSKYLVVDANFIEPCN